MTKLTTAERIQLVDMSEQALKESVDWHKANSPQLTPHQIAAFEAGYSEGWNAALVHINLHARKS